MRRSPPLPPDIELINHSMCLMVEYLRYAKYANAILSIEEGSINLSNICLIE